MKYVLSLVLGMLAGVALAAVVIYFNPLTRRQSEAADNVDWRLGYSIGAVDTWLSTHDKRLELPLVPDNAPLIQDRGIRGAWLAAVPLEGQGVGNAAGSRISVPSAATEFLLSGLLVDDFWLISVPGQGSVFVHSVSNQWPLFRDTVVRVGWLRRDWSGPVQYGPTRGPDSAGASVIGMTGRFADTRGRGRERLSLESYPGRLTQLSGELRLEISASGK